MLIGVVAGYVSVWGHTLKRFKSGPPRYLWRQLNRCKPAYFGLGVVCAATLFALYLSLDFTGVDNTAMAAFDAQQRMTALLWRLAVLTLGYGVGAAIVASGVRRKIAHQSIVVEPYISLPFNQTCYVVFGWAGMMVAVLVFLVISQFNGQLAWQSWWFYALCGVAIAVPLIWLYHVYFGFILDCRHAAANQTNANS